MSNNKPNVAVIGAGVVGTTVARLLQEQMRNAQITIIADKYKEDTTSYVAAGIFRPGTSFKGPTKKITKTWIDDSWNYWQKIFKSSGTHGGVMSLSSYILSKENQHVTRNHLIEDLVPSYRSLEKDELRTLGPQFKYGSVFSTIKIECSRYVPWAEKQFLDSGGSFLNRHVENFASLSVDYDLVFNCTGMGAKSLCNDHDLVAMRGQVAVVRAPWIKNAYYMDYDTYIIPGFDGLVTLGGVRHYDSYNRQFCKYDAEAILNRCYSVMPSLKDAEIVRHKVGLRPHRVPVRVEMEIVDGTKVVHCYGHGGYGVTCAPGTAMQAVNMGMNFWRSNARSRL